MKKAITLILPLSLLTFACASPSNQSDTQVSGEPDTEVTVTGEAKTAKVALVSPQGDIPMGDVELILEVQDGTSGDAVAVETIEVNSTMPMEGEDPMISKVEIESTDTPGQFKIKTNFSMAGTWNLAATVNDGNYQGGNEITLEVK